MYVHQIHPYLSKHCHQITNEQSLAISYSQISRLGSQEIWKRDFVYVDDLAKMGGGALLRFVRNDTFNLHWDEENHVDVPPKTGSEIVNSKQYTLFADQ